MIIHEIRDFTNQDYMGYAGAVRLPGNNKPKIVEIESDDTGVDIILSGDGAGSTIITMSYEDACYIISIPGYNMCHLAIVDSMLGYFKYYNLLKEAVDAVVSDYEMKECNYGI